MPDGVGAFSVQRLTNIMYSKDTVSRVLACLGVVTVL